MCSTPFRGSVEEAKQDGLMVRKALDMVQQLEDEEARAAKQSISTRPSGRMKGSVIFCCTSSSSTAWQVLNTLGLLCHLLHPNEAILRGTRAQQQLHKSMQHASTVDCCKLVWLQTICNVRSSPFTCSDWSWLQGRVSLRQRRSYSTTSLLAVM